MSWLAWPWYFICKVNSANRVMLLKNKLCTLCLRVWGFHLMPFFNCNILQGAYYGALLGLLSCKSDSRRRGTCTKVLLVCEGQVRELVQPGRMWELPWGLLCGTSGRKELCMVPCHSCQIYGIWTSRSKKVWGMLKSHQLGVAMQVTKGGLFS